MSRYTPQGLLSPLIGRECDASDRVLFLARLAAHALNALAGDPDAADALRRALIALGLPQPVETTGGHAICPHCGWLYIRPDGSPLVPVHNWPESSLALCPGSHQTPRNPETDRRPLCKDLGRGVSCGSGGPSGG